MPGQNNYQIAYKKAVEELLKREIEEICDAAGVGKYKNGSSIIAVPFINKDILVSYPHVNISYSNNEEVQLWLKILLLHYLSQADGTPASGKYITFKEISGGLAYYPNFQMRSVTPILKTYSGNYEGFIKAAENIGGVRSDFGEYSVSFQVFPRIKIIYNIWKGDEELPAEGNVIFDSSITNYFTSEDIVVMCNMIAVMIIKNK